MSKVYDPRESQTMQRIQRDLQVFAGVALAADNLADSDEFVAKAAPADNEVPRVQIRYFYICVYLRSSMDLY